MKKTILLSALSVCFLILPVLAAADCINIGGFNRFSLQGSTVTVYSGSSPVARFDIQNCSVQPSSRIELIKSNVCDGDEILVDGARCTMMEIKSLGP